MERAPYDRGPTPQRHGTNRLVRVDESCDVTGPVVEWLSGGARRAGSTGVMDADLANGGPGRPERYSRTGDRVCMDQTAIDRDRVGERADGLPVSAEAAHIAGAKGEVHRGQPCNPMGPQVPNASALGRVLRDRWCR